MLEITKQTDAVTVRSDSKLNMLPVILDVCDEFLHRHKALRSQDLRVIARELLRNAMTHGNECRTERVVVACVRCSDDGTFSITVEDEGTGFDHEGLEHTLPDDPRDVRNRGLRVVNALAESLEFNSAGNRVTAVIKANQR